jgi:hypothetical protein
MDDYRKEDRAEPHPADKAWSNQTWENRAPGRATRWLVILSVLFLGAAVAAFGYGYEQNSSLTALAEQNQTLHSAITQMRSQLDQLTTKLNQIAAAPPQAASDSSANGTAPTSTSTPNRNRNGAGTLLAARSTAQDRRIKKLQADLDAQKTQLKQTQDDVASTKSDFDGKLGSTRDELNGSIAKTHEELVALSKRSERNFYEFDLSKSKTFQREGPIQVSLRKADPKHQSYDLMMLVDDHQLSKKKVNLYEPVWLHQSDQPQPLQVVVNKIDKDRIHGYISAPKYSESEISSNTQQSEQDFTSHPTPSSSTPSTSPSSNSTSTPASSPDNQQSQ